MAEPFEIQWDAGGSSMLLLGFRGTERLSAPFRFSLYVSLPADALPPSTDALGSPVTISLRANADAVEPMHGIVAAMRVVEPSPERVVAELVMVPRLWRLGQSLHSRVFTEQSVPDVVRAVLESGGLAEGSDFELRLQGTYAPEAHICQAHESDLGFVDRWLEREGMSYFFEHADGTDKLVVVDHLSAHPRRPVAAIRYYPVAAGAGHRGDFDRFASQKRLVPAKVRLVDYDHARPSLDVSGEADCSELTSQVVVEHGVRIIDPAEGARLAKLRAEEILCRQRTFRASGPVFHLGAGFKFELVDHPREAANREYLCIELEHHANSRATTPELQRLLGVSVEDVYRVDATAIESDVQFRPVRKTAWPRLRGLERATVDGPAESEYAQIDDAGLYRVKVGFDESTLDRGKASAAVRMMQPHAGNPEGFHFPLRKGTEVLLGFLAGDPDRPFIAAAVPNAQTPTTIAEPDQTRNMLRTGGENVLEIEDQEGGQWCDWRCPTADSFLHLGKPYNPAYHVVLHTGQDCLFYFGDEQRSFVGGDFTEEVGAAVIEHYDTSQLTEVAGAQTTTVTNDVLEHYTGGQLTHVTGQVTELYFSGQKTTVAGQRFELHDSSQTTLVLGNVTQTFNVGQTMTVNGPSTQQVGGTKSVTVSGQKKHLFDAAVTQTFGPVVEICPSIDWQLPAGTTITTPSVQMLTASYNLQTTNQHQVEASKTETTSCDIGLIPGTKFEATGASAGWTNLKIEVAGPATELFGFKGEFKGINFDTSGFFSTNSGAQGG